MLTRGERFAAIPQSAHCGEVAGDVEMPVTSEEEVYRPHARSRGIALVSTTPPAGSLPTNQWLAWYQPIGLG